MKSNLSSEKNFITALKKEFAGAYEKFLVFEAKQGIWTSMCFLLVAYFSKICSIAIRYSKTFGSFKASLSGCANAFVKSVLYFNDEENLLIYENIYILLKPHLPQLVEQSLEERKDVRHEANGIRCLKMILCSSLHRYPTLEELFENAGLSVGNLKSLYSNILTKDKVQDSKFAMTDFSKKGISMTWENIFTSFRSKNDEEQMLFLLNCSFGYSGGNSLSDLRKQLGYCDFAKVKSSVGNVQDFILKETECR